MVYFSRSLVINRNTYCERWDSAKKKKKRQVVERVQHATLGRESIRVSQINSLFDGS